MRLCSSLKLCILALSGLVLACAGPRLKLPEYCSPLPGSVVCEDATYLFPEAGEFLCFKPEQIEPFLNRCGK